jgi:outer membrane protein
MNGKLVRVVSMAALLALPLQPVTAGDWEVGFRVVGLAPNDASGTLGPTGSRIKVDSDIAPEVDLTYRINDHWAVELIVAATEHDLGLAGGLLDEASAGRVTIIPPTLTLQFYSGPKSTFSSIGFDQTRFYAGVGLNYTAFHGYDLSSDLTALGISDIRFEDSWGAAGQVGFDVDINGNWTWNIDVKYLQMSTEADLRFVTGGSFDVVDVDVDPWVLGAGAAYRF